MGITLLPIEKTEVFMEENQNAVTQTEPVATENKTEVSGEQPVEKTEKTYTQEEVNALDKKLKEKYEKKYAGIDLKKYKEWEESQKTDSQKKGEKPCTAFRASPRFRLCRLGRHERMAP